MYVLKVENEKGEILRLSQNEGMYQVLEVDGLYPVKAQINTTEIAGVDGSKFNSSKLNERAITLTLKINGNIEQNRINLYRFFTTKKKCKLYYTNESREVYIEGYCEAHKIPQFTKSEKAQISIVCPNPYFKALDYIVTDMSSRVRMFKFPFSFGGNGATHISAQTESDDAIPFSEIIAGRVSEVLNDSESETGVIIMITFTANINKLVITNAETTEQMDLRYAFHEDDYLVINTNIGEKSITLTRNGIKYNLFNALQSGASFLKLRVGFNYFSYAADNGTNDSYVQLSFKYQPIYGGV